MTTWPFVDQAALDRWTRFVNRHEVGRSTGTRQGCYECMWNRDCKQHVTGIYALKATEVPQ